MDGGLPGGGGTAVYRTFVGEMVGMCLVSFKGMRWTGAAAAAAVLRADGSARDKFVGFR